MSPISPGWFPAQTWSSTCIPTMVLWNISPNPSALLRGTALGRVGMVGNGRGGIQGALGTLLRNFSCAGTAGISGQPRGRFGGLLQGSPGAWSLPGLRHDRAAGSTTARMLSGMVGQCLSPLGHNWPSSGVLQVLARAGRAQRLHGTGVGTLQHVLIPQGEEEEAAGWADAEPAKHTGPSTNTSEFESN